MTRFVLIEGPIPNAPEAKYVSQIPSPNNLMQISTALKSCGLKDKDVSFYQFLRERNPPIVHAENIVYNAGEATCIDPLYNYSNQYLQKLRDHNPTANIYLTGNYSWLHKGTIEDQFLDGNFIQTDPFYFENDVLGLGAALSRCEYSNDWEINDWAFMQKYVKYKYYGMRCTIRSSRGCAYGKCRMCPVAIVYKPPGKVIRFSIEWVIYEIEHLYHHYGVREIGFLDDNLFSDRKYGKQLLRILIDLKGKSLHKYMRFTFEEGLTVPEALDEELVSLLKQAGFYHIKLGVEGLDRVKLDFIRKPYRDPSKAIRAIKMLQKYKLNPVCFICIGFPTDTIKSIRKDIKTFVELGVKLRVQILWPYPGIDFCGQKLSNQQLILLQQEAMEKTGSTAWKRK